jgi:hypothetical protein
MGKLQYRSINANSGYLLYAIICEATSQSTTINHVSAHSHQLNFFLYFAAIKNQPCKRFWLPVAAATLDHIQ